MCRPSGERIHVPSKEKAAKEGAQGGNGKTTSVSIDP